MTHEPPNRPRCVRALATSILLLGLVACTATATNQPAAPRSTSTSLQPPVTVSTSPTTVTTWDGAVLHTPGLDIALDARRVYFGFHNGTTLYSVPDGEDGSSWHVVHGDDNVTLDADTASISPDGRWVATYKATVVKRIDDFTSVAVQRIVRRHVRSGAERSLTLPAMTLTCCDAGGTTLVQAVTNTGRVILWDNSGGFPLVGWDGRQPPVPIRTGPFVARTQGGFAPMSWSPDHKSYLDGDTGGLSVGRREGGRFTESRLDLPQGSWTFGAWETPTTLVLARYGRSDRARAIVRCDTDTSACAVTSDPPGTLKLPDLL